MQKDKNKQHRKKIIIASVLKPISDPRMFEKFGLSLGKTDKYLIFLTGYTGKYMNIYPNIRFKQLYDFGRLNPLRIFAPFSFFLYAFKVNPRIIIIQTHELIWASCFCKLLFGVKIIYDVQENYYRNLMFSGSYYSIFRLPLAFYVRFKEKVTRGFMDHYILAERCYADELDFLPKNKYTVVENKYIHPESDDAQIENPIKSKMRFVFTGTVAESTGVFDAINLVKEMYKIDNQIYLVIVGQCSNPKDQKRLRKIAGRYKFVKLKCKSTPVNHSDILEEINESRFGIISYPVNKITSKKFPTKLYEYLANNLPVICTNNELWEELINKHQGGIMLDFKEINAAAVLKKLNETTFFANQHPKDDLLWEHEEHKLIKVIDEILE